MEILWIIVGSLFIVAGFAGVFVPVIPGTPLIYVSLLIMQLALGAPFTWTFLILWGIAVAIVATLDGLIPAEGARRMGGSKYGIYGCLIGAFIGLVFFPPFGIIVGPIVGAFGGELLAGRKSGSALKAAMGSFIGFLVATVLKMSVSVILAYYFFSNI
ncbi:DUF456 domain-containing protein [Rhodohalobacter sulfatireducens]|uniref:DUF456 domain-containing protein n=1 Tax=Rhodohalobacter sulfatireducens TaxID=2911366 RepID=A0ABS9K9X7_9BACT|nr:DUF456 family protein [Rhodohalobacter sulfatireducens]MCG2587646.1 DUF456 domain-containing protein [Rhodohalobacter sulfatireducens]MDR9366116.1 DUF456 family protein [Balneolaceae bacterium]MDR9409526.1 DUF456 family protein [Balneolaceae bacterium]